MSVEVNPVGVTCNLSCPYCYENPMRDAGNFQPDTFSLDAMIKGLEKEGERFTVFGGEPLLLPIYDLEKLFEYGYKKYRGSSVQTNGALITEEHLALFKKYNVSIGISLDGPGELNDTRWAGSLEKTRQATTASHSALVKMMNRGISVSLIVTLSRVNASAERLPKLVDWFRRLDEIGLRYCRLHLLEIDHADVRDKLALSEDENVEAMITLMELQNELSVLRFDIFAEMAQLLLGTASSYTCVWGACDPLTTRAVRGINANGGRTNCSRTNKEGVEWVKADTPGNERYLVLHQTPQEDGGCKDCRFFFACKGQCPGTAIDGDWRNRSEQCRVWYRIFEHIESDLVSIGAKPISLNDARRAAAEARVLEGSNSLDREHGDHWDAPDGYQHDDNGFSVHGDHGTTTTHGDTPHGDHTDDATLNGFRSISHQNAAHEFVLAELSKAKTPLSMVFDLGAGDGTLLKKVKDRGLAECVVGIEADASRIRHPWVRHGHLRDLETVIPEWFPESSVALISENRLNEAIAEGWIKPLQEWLTAHTHQVLVYSYEKAFARLEDAI